MKRVQQGGIRLVAILLAGIAILLTGIGGFLDAWKENEILISKQHAWHDGMFILVFAIFLLILNVTQRD